MPTSILSQSKVYSHYPSNTFPGVITILTNREDTHNTSTSNTPPKSTKPYLLGIRGMPNIRDHDASVYLKVEGDGLAVGGYEMNPLFWPHVCKYIACICEVVYLRGKDDYRRQFLDYTSIYTNSNNYY